MVEICWTSSVVQRISCQSVVGVAGILRMFPQWVASWHPYFLCELCYLSIANLTDGFRWILAIPQSLLQVLSRRRAHHWSYSCKDRPPKSHHTWLASTLVKWCSIVACCNPCEPSYIGIFWRAQQVGVGFDFRPHLSWSLEMDLSKMPSLVSRVCPDLPARQRIRCWSVLLGTRCLPDVERHLKFWHFFDLSWDLRRCLEWDQHRKSFLAEHINVL